MHPLLTSVIQVGFVVLSSVGAHPWAQRMAPTDERTTKPVQLKHAQPTSDFVGQIPEGLQPENVKDQTAIHPLILLKSLIFLSVR